LDIDVGYIVTIILKNINGFVIGITSIISFDSYRRLLNNSYINKNTNDLLQETVIRSTEIVDKLDQVLDKNKTDEILENRLNQLKDNLESINTNSSELSKFNIDNIVLQSYKDFIIDRSKYLTESVNKYKSILDEIIKMISDNNNGNHLTVNEIYTQYINFLSSLTTIQVGALCYILLSITIIYLLTNILLAHYGDKIIKYFKIEIKYPNLSKFIMLRRKFNDFI